LLFFPADLPHVFTVVSEEPVKVLVIYSPPYGDRVVWCEARRGPHQSPFD
jgi:hypothetical protein